MSMKLSMAIYVVESMDSLPFLIYAKEKFGNQVKEIENALDEYQVIIRAPVESFSLKSRHEESLEMFHVNTTMAGDYEIVVRFIHRNFVKKHLHLNPARWTNLLLEK